jgi:hypothetical protein
MYDNDYNYARTRLQDTLIKDDQGKPLYVVDVTSQGVIAEYFDGEDHKVLKLDEVVVTDLKLGFVNYRGKAYYLARQPKRRDWRQGVRGQNVCSLSGALPLSNSTLAQCLRGDFPSLSGALQKASEVAESIAWARDWALSKSLELLYKGEGVVGKVVDGELELNTKFSYLQEALTEAEHAAG